jgi:hypothetical protein
VDGPSATAGAYIYYVRIDCSRRIHVKVHLYRLHRNTPCEWIAPGDVEGFESQHPDGSWQAVAR